MRNSSEIASPSSNKIRSKKPILRSSKSQSKDSYELSTKTPEKPSQRTRNRGVALSLSDIRKVAKGLQDQKQSHETTSFSKAKTARRQIEMASPRKTNISVDESLKLPKKYAFHHILHLIFSEILISFMLIEIDLYLIAVLSRYENLGEFFDSLDSSIRLLRLKGSMTSFTNIRPKIETLTDRYGFCCRFNLFFLKILYCDFL